MRRTRTLICLFAAIALVALTGCFDVEQHLTINSDGSADVENTITMDSSLLDAAAQESGGEDVSGIFDELSVEAEGEGFKVEDVEKDGQTGIKATKHIDDISDFDLKDLGEGTDGEIKIENSFLRSKYTVDLSLPFEADTGTGDLGGDPAATEGLVEARFMLTLPGKIGDNNADSISDDGKTATWELVPGEEVKIEATAEGYNTLVVAGIGGGGLLLVVIIVVVIVVLARRKSRPAVAPAPYGGPESPTAPTAFAPAPEPMAAPAPEAVPQPVPEPTPEVVAPVEAPVIEAAPVVAPQVEAPAPVPEPEVAPSAPEPAPAPEGEVPTGKTCAQCGAQNDASATVCAGCGAPLS
ncbi:MAG: hypothetical protein OEV43_04310 [Coriobacteriia bacterium]|nr:hypothetical protein [Coriobacteriia bacterium]